MSYDIDQRPVIMHNKRLPGIIVETEGNPYPKGRRDYLATQGSNRQDSYTQAFTLTPHFRLQMQCLCVAGKI